MYGYGYKYTSGLVINSGGGGAPFANTKSLLFDGVDDYVDCGNITELNSATAFTISGWYKQTTLNEFRIFFGAGTGLSKLITCYTFTDGRMYLDIRNGSTTYGSFLYNSVVNSGEWFSLVCVFNGGGATDSDKFKLYINGSEQTLTYNGTLPTVMDSNLGDFTIGENTLFAGGEWLGNIDEVCILDRVVTPAEIVTLSTAPTVDLTDLNPIAWYRNGDNGSWKSPQWLIPNNENKDKVSNYSFEFDGVNDYINCGDSNDFSFGNGVTDSPFSISAWIKMDSASGFRIFNKYAGSENEYSFGMGGASFLQLYLFDSTSNFKYRARVYNTILNTGQWYHVAATYSGVGGTNAQDGIKIYVDGVRVDDSTVSGGAYVAMGNKTTPVYIGKLNTSYANGQIDEVSVFNSELSQSDITDIYNGVQPTTISGAVAHYKMGEEANFTSNWLVDNSALTNYSKRSFEFDGVDDYINLGDIAALNNTTNFTYSGWYNQPTLDVRGTMLNSGYNSSNQEFILFYTWVDGRMILQIGDSGVNPYASFDYSLYVTAGQWFHFAYVYNGNGITEANKVQIYINGAPITLTFTGTMHSSTPVGANITKISSSSSITTYAWGGKIDEAAFFDYSLTQQNVTDIYNGGIPNDLTELSPLHWYRMGEDASFNGTNWTVPDNVGSNNGTSNAMMVDALVGEAPNYSGGGISNAMTIEDRVGEAPNSTNNALSLNMDFEDVVTDTP